MPKIQGLLAREIIDSRGNPTIEVEVSTDSLTARARPFPQGLPQGLTRRMKCETKTLNAIWGKAF